MSMRACARLRSGAMGETAGIGRLRVDLRNWHYIPHLFARQPRARCG
eukprot:CAMPEP_0180072410 /NCGR_PEP_ID=MMETSP0985-20121206/12705_1 /TAXON_ID=483367 /ORGANISM="non described non described, Strain CCMP 2436" /LENGTH=46 /DNA_ID= /DNA_START= /DNA_END= /DNA_ORIENTATION=